MYPFPAWELTDAGDEPLYVSSLRLEALRQSVEDYEYLRILAQAGETRPDDTQANGQTGDLLRRMEALITSSAANDRTMHAQGVFYLLDGREYYELRREIGRAITSCSRR